MQQIERVGVVALLFLVVTIVVVAFWDDSQRSQETRAAQRDARGAPPAERARTENEPARVEPDDGRVEAHRARERLGAPLARGEERGTPLGEREARPERRGPAEDVVASADERADSARREGRRRTLELDLPQRTNGAEEEALLRMGLGNAPDPAVLAAPASLERRVEPASRKEKPSLQPAASAAPQVYVVKSGDTLERIARRVLGDARRVADILALNGLKDPNRIVVGQKLALPGAGDAPLEPVASASTPERPKEKTAPAPKVETKAAGAGRSYVVRKGDTLSLIAQRELGDAKLWPKIAALNPKVDPNRVVVGASLVLPASGGAPPPAKKADRSGQRVAAAGTDSDWRVR